MKKSNQLKRLIFLLLLIQIIASGHQHLFAQNSDSNNYAVTSKKPIPQYPGKGLRNTFQLGSSLPLNSLNKTSDANIHFQAGIHYPFKNKYWNQFDILLGFHQFTREPTSNLNHSSWANINLGYTRKYAFNVAKEGFTRIACGYYKNKGGTNTAGFQLGTGLAFPLTYTNKLTIGMDYHLLLQDPNEQFLSLSLGIDID